MSEFLTELLRKFGIALIPALVVFLIGVWAVVHRSAEPGENISVLWGMVEYTKGAGSSGAGDSASVGETGREGVPSVHPIGSPSPRKRGVLVDTSHGQGSWPRNPMSLSVFRLDSLKAVLGANDWDLRAIEDARQIRASDLASWQGLVFAMPYETDLEPAARDEIVSWVRDGGRLLLLGFEMGDRHHGGNLNFLAGEFGIHFNSGDIVAPAGWNSIQKPYGRVLSFAASELQEHSLFESIGTLRMKNVCTLTTEPGTISLVFVGSRRIGRLADHVALYDNDGRLRAGEQVFDFVDAPRSLVMAQAPRGLAGNGSAIAIGTWQLLGNDIRGPQTIAFLKNLFSWLAGERK